MIFCALLLLVVSAYGQDFTQKCVHTNAQLRTADSVISQIMDDMDTDKDHYITDLELLVEFVGRFDDNQDSSISRGEFVSNWHKLYHDVPDFADYMFDHFDRNGDGRLGLFDVPALKAAVDIDNDDKISEVEFTIFMTHLYQDCVPHTHLVAVPF